MTRVYLIRHGETDWNRDRICMGQADIPINQVGCRQAELVAERLRDLPIDAVYASDLARAAETARPLAEARGLSPTLLRELRELDYGDWQGHRDEELPRRFPEAFQKDPRRDSLAFHPQGGESVHALYERSVRALMAILERHAGETVAVVAHGGVIRCLANFVLGRGAPTLEGPLFTLGFKVSNGSITLLEAEEDGALQLSYLNDTCHLGDSEPSGSR